MKRTWQDNAVEFAALDRGEGWQFAVLVACSVQKFGHGGDRRSSRDHDLKVGAREFAERASTSTDRVLRYYNAWQDAAAKGWVQDAEQLRPEHAHDLPLPDKPWRSKEGGVYSDRSKSGGQINDVSQIADKAARDPQYAQRVVREVAKASPQATAAARQALDEQWEESRQHSELRRLDRAHADSQHDAAADTLSLIVKMRAAHRALADAMTLAQDVRGPGADKMREAVHVEVDWIRGACEVIEAGVDGGSMDDQLRELLDAEAGS
jgi:hypothetical protein